MNTEHTALVAEAAATIDEHLDGATTDEEATSLIRAALRRHVAGLTSSRRYAILRAYLPGDEVPPAADTRRT